jgi:predicted RNase H-like nuclease
MTDRGSTAGVDGGNTVTWGARHGDPYLVGVDGCRGGWVAVVARASAPDRLISVEVLDHIEPLIERVRSGEIAALAVDMPMGLPDAGPRRCDIETRALLGPRASSVFATPIRPLLHSRSHAEAVELGRALDGRGISIQAFNLLPKIAQVDGVLRRHHHPLLFERVFEAHPEAAFADLAGSPLLTRKRTAEGRAERLEMLGDVLPGSGDLLTRRHRGAASDDVLDAAVLVRTAQRINDGSATILGGGTLDRHGIPMRVAI